MVSTHLKNISQIGSFPQVGVKIKNVLNHHPGMCIYIYKSHIPHNARGNDDVGQHVFQILFYVSWDPSTWTVWGLKFTTQTEGQRVSICIGTWKTKNISKVFKFTFFSWNLRVCFPSCWGSRTFYDLWSQHFLGGLTKICWTAGLHLSGWTSRLWRWSFLGGPSQSWKILQESKYSQQHSIFKHLTCHTYIYIYK